jgi:hypothetical protein
VIHNVNAALALCLALAACSSASKAAPTGGPYHYESTEGGVTITSTVNVHYGADAAVVDEDVKFGQVTASIENRLDPKTFSAISYTMRNDPEGLDPVIVVSPGGASVKMNDRGGAVVKAPAPGAPSWILGNYASSFVLLPSLVRATHPQALNAYMPTVFHGKGFAFKLSVVPTTPARPAAVPAGDASISLGRFNSRKRLPMVTVWYDPASSVVDEIDMAGTTAFVRKP